MLIHFKMRKVNYDVAWIILSLIEKEASNDDIFLIRLSDCAINQSDEELYNLMMKLAVINHTIDCNQKFSLKEFWTSLKVFDE